MAGSISFNLRRDLDVYPQVPIVDLAKGWAATFFYCKDKMTPNWLEGLPPFVDTAGTPLPSWKTKPAARTPTEIAAIEVRITELTSGSPPLTGEDTMLCWMRGRSSLLSTVLAFCASTLATPTPCGSTRRICRRRISKAATTNSSRPGQTKADNTSSRGRCTRPPTLPQRYLYSSAKLNSLQGSTCLLIHLSLLVFRLSDCPAKSVTFATTSSKTTKRATVVSSALPESCKRKSHPLTISIKPSDDDDALAGLNIPVKK